jgi:hypothetical protein
MRILTELSKSKHLVLSAIDLSLKSPLISNQNIVNQIVVKINSIIPF